MFIKEAPAERNFRFNYSYIAVNENEEILLANVISPIIRIFDSKGNMKCEQWLELDKLINDKELKKKIKINGDIRRFEKEKDDNKIFQDIIWQACADDKDFYLLIWRGYIVRLSDAGEIKDIITLDFGHYKKDRSCYAFNFDVRKNKIAVVTGNSIVLSFNRPVNNNR